MATPKQVVIDVVSDMVCPWCYIGKLRLERAMAKHKDDIKFQVHWRPFQLNPGAPKQGVNKMEYYKQKFGETKVATIIPMMTRTFAEEGRKYNMDGMTGNTFDAHRLVWWAGAQHGTDVQNALIEELFYNYFCEAKFINDKDVLLEAAKKVGLEGAEKVLDDEDLGAEEVQKELTTFSRNVTGVPHFIVNGKYHLGGAQAPEEFERVFNKL